MRVVIIPLRYKANVVFLNSELALFALTCCLVLFLFIFWKRGDWICRSRHREHTHTHRDTQRQTERQIERDRQSLRKT